MTNVPRKGAVLLLELDRIVRTVLTSKYKRRDSAGAARKKGRPRADKAKEVEA